ncbi:MAG: SufD family Fe-S cluster assembly protein [Rikenellaceae bacterium]|jgi:Fe-S cluster assembly protein SufD|nr:SufD family Fe-S cluster assembly protein [Rikenellaceae bacterium]
MTIEQRYAELYAATAERIGRGFPFSVNSRRRQMLDDFLLCGVPDTREERYRYTDMRRTFGRALHVALPDEGHFGSGAPFGLRNGYCVDEDRLDVADNGVIIGSLRAASVDYEQIVLDHYNSMAANKADALTALNSAFAPDGAIVYVPDNVAAGSISVELDYDSRYPDALIFSRLLVIVGRGGSAEVSVSYRCREGYGMVVDHVTEVVAGEDSHLTISELHDFSDNCTAILNGYSRVAAAGKLDRIFVSLGGEALRADYHCDLVGGGAQGALYGLFITGKAEKVDIYTATNHLVPDGSSYQMVKGLASGSSTGVFSGRIYIAPDAGGASAEQHSRNITLTPDARIVTAPQLEIYAEDVRCSHGASVGQLDDQAIYYMRQRGIDHSTARRLQIAGFMNDIVARCSDEQFSSQLHTLIDSKIDAF